MSHPLPSGTVTFLFTDIEGSSALWESREHEMRSLLAEHDRRIRSAIRSADGVVFKTAGDAFLCAFVRPENAALAARAAQRALREAPPADGVKMPRVRMAIHSGIARARRGDYVGPTLNRTARILGLARGEQILVSGATAHLLEQTMPGDLSLRALGSYRLKGLARAESIHQLCADDLRADFPGISASDRAGNIPAQASSFVGRKNELRELVAALKRHRLVTIVGPGGIGKTRLALEVARRAEKHFPDGAWFAQCAQARDGDDVPALLCAAVAVEELPAETSQGALVRCIGEKHLLLVVDNAEHLLKSIARLVRTIVAACPNLRVLVTSREPLHDVSELAYRLGPLGLAGDAGALFRDRALAAGGAIGNADAGHLRAICAHLDGIPLAIELAAARTATFSLADLEDRLAAPLAMLVSKSTGDDERHRTLRGTIDWSFRLLDEREQRFFAALSIFRGGFSIESARHVAGPSLEDTDVDAALEALVDTSLVVRVAGERSRYVLLETIAAYARERLRESGAEDALAHRHFDYFVRLASSYRMQELSLERWRQAVDTDLTNLYAAVDFGIERGLADVVTCACDLAPYWQTRRFLEGRARVDRIAHDPRFASAPGMAALYRRASTLATMADDYAAARDMASRALAIFEAAHDARGAAEVRFNLAVIAQRAGNEDDVQSLYEQCLQEFRAAGHDRGTIATLNNLALVYIEKRDYAAAERYAGESAQIAARVGDATALGEIYGTQCWIYRRTDRLNDAWDCARRAMENAAAAGNPHLTLDALLQMTSIHIARKDAHAARPTAAEALTIARELGSPLSISHALERLASVLHHEGRALDAAFLLGAAARLRGPRGAQTRIDETLELDVVQLRGSLGTGAFEGAYSDGMNADDDRVAAISAASARLTSPSSSG